MALSQESVFFDTSVLLPGLIDFGEQSLAPLRLLDEVAGGNLRNVHSAWHCCLELYSVATRLPAEYRLPGEVAARLLEEEIQDRFQIHGLPEAGKDGYFSAASKDGVMGGRVYDFHIAETARLAGVHIVVTENRRHFTSLLRYGIRVVTASELMAELCT